MAAAISRSSSSIARPIRSITATRQHRAPAGRHLALADPALGRPMELRDSCASFCRPISLARQDARRRASPSRARPRGWDSAQERERDLVVRSLNRPIGPGQNRSSSARSWLTSAALAPTSSSRPRVIAPRLGGSQLGSTSEAMVIVRASSHNTNTSNPSDSPPATRNRGRAAATDWGAAPRPAAPRRERSTSSPSGRSIATSCTFNRTSARHTIGNPCSSCANVAASSFSPAASATSTSCFSDAQLDPGITSIHL